MRADFNVLRRLREAADPKSVRSLGQLRGRTAVDTHDLQALLADFDFLDATARAVVRSAQAEGLIGSSS